MKRVISLFNDPSRREEGPPVGLEEFQREPIYFQHLMDYLQRRQPDSVNADAAVDVEEGSNEACACS